VTSSRFWRSALVTMACVGAMGLAQACNAIVGNGDIQIVSDSGLLDATLPDGGLEAAMTADVGGEEGRAAETGPADAGVDVLSVGMACEAGTKQCGTICATFVDPAFGCSPTHCTPCELPNAFAGCGPPDGSTDGAVACSVSGCTSASRSDCNGNPLDGCEVDTRNDLYNCGACGHDCTSLPNVAGNVSCVAGVCSFDTSACAPGYGICSTDPDMGCDTVFSAPKNCGACGNACPANFPYCSPAGSSFACTSGCAPGLSLCGASCVNLQTDPTHCRACGTQCPGVSAGTATCSAAVGCGFTCNANDHLCGTGAGASCAANNDPTNCGTGASCGVCPAPANAIASCTNGTTCGYACNASAHPCGATCPLDDDPNNCGDACGTNCPGPTQGAGAATCNGNNCAIACTNPLSLCGTACVNQLVDNANCGSCDHSCGAGQTCSGGQCVCNTASCPGGCCDASGSCHAAPLCGTAGAACTPGCPGAVPEAANLVLWLAGDTYGVGTSTWADQSGHGANAMCTSCPATAGTTVNGHAAVAFDGSSFFALGDPASQYQTSSFTIFAVAAPDPGSVANAALLTFADGTGNAVALQRSGTANDLLFQLLPGSTVNSLVAPGAWQSSFELITATIDSTHGALSIGSSAAVTGSIGTPAFVDYLSSFLGSDPSHALNYTGQLAEVLVFNTTAVPSTTSIQSYLSARYALP
jgi:hypothetical protein